MIFQIKKFSEKLLNPIGKKLSDIPANYFTFLSLISCILASLCFYYNLIILSIILILLIEFFDQLDGVIARIQGPTEFGAFLDSTLDRFGDGFLFIGIIFGSFNLEIVGIFVLIGAFLTSYTRVRIESLIEISLGGIGLFERTDRIPVLFISSIFQIWVLTGLFWGMLVLLFGTYFTAFQRIYYAYTHLSHENKKSELLKNN